MPGLLDNRLLIVTGKGGVGKSAVAAALALSSARAGLRTLVCEVAAQERISHLLDKPEVGPEIRPLEQNLWAVNIRFDEALREYALMQLKFKSVYRAVFENRLVRYFLRFLPSLQELILLGKIYYHVRNDRDERGELRFDRIIVDAPATGHAITFFSVPQVLVDTVPAGPLSAEAERMRAVLEDPAVTAAVLVSLPEELPVNETIDLDRALRDRVRIHTRAAVLNGFIPTRFSDDDVAATAGARALHPIVAARRERERQSTDAFKRLETALGVPIHPVPRLFVDRFGPEAILEIARHLAPALEVRP